MRVKLRNGLECEVLLRNQKADISETYNVLLALKEPYNRFWAGIDSGSFLPYCQPFFALGFKYFRWISETGLDCEEEGFSISKYLQRIRLKP